MVFRLEDIPVACEHERDLGIGHDHHGLQPAEVPVGAPVFRKFDGGPHELVGILFEFGFEALEEGKRVGRGAGKARNDVALSKAPDLPRIRFHNGLAKADLTVACNDNAAALADGEDGRCMPALEAGSV